MKCFPMALSCPWFKTKFVIQGVCFWGQNIFCTDNDREPKFRLWMLRVVKFHSFHALTSYRKDALFVLMMFYWPFICHLHSGPEELLGVRRFRWTFVCQYSCFTVITPLSSQTCGIISSFKKTCGSFTMTLMLIHWGVSVVISERDCSNPNHLTRTFRVISGMVWEFALSLARILCWTT